MDLPGNPAKLEQRIGRVHRMGRSRSVQVINFVAQGSIEKGMLGALTFKKSLFAGVLDGGDSAVFMNGTRLSKFMVSVDEVTGAMGAAEDAAAKPLAPSEAQARAAGSEGELPQSATSSEGTAADHDADLSGPIGDAPAAADPAPRSTSAELWALCLKPD